jgi:hypothetical protein
MDLIHDILKKNEKHILGSGNGSIPFSFIIKWFNSTSIKKNMDLFHNFSQCFHLRLIQFLIIFADPYLILFFYLYQKNYRFFYPQILSLSSQKYGFGIRENLFRILGYRRHWIPDLDPQHQLFFDIVSESGSVCNCRSKHYFVHK